MIKSEKKYFLSFLINGELKQNLFLNLINVVFYFIWITFLIMFWYYWFFISIQWKNCARGSTWMQFVSFPTLN